MLLSLCTSCSSHCLLSQSFSRITDYETWLQVKTWPESWDTVWKLRHRLSGLRVEIPPERPKSWNTARAAWWLRQGLSSDIKRLRHRIKMRQGIDETQNKYVRQGTKLRCRLMRQGTELRCIASTDGTVCLTSTVCRHSMTVLSTVSRWHIRDILFHRHNWSSWSNTSKFCVFSLVI